MTHPLPPPPPPPRPVGSRRAALLKLGALAAILVMAAVAAWAGGFTHDPRKLLRLARRARALRAFPPLFVLAYAALVAIGFPGTPLAIAGGVMFDFALAAALNWAATVLGCAGGYWIARRFGKGSIQRLVGRRASALERLKSGRGFAVVFRMQLLPIVPMAAVNLAAGTVPVPFGTFLLATALGVIPGTTAYTYFSHRLVAGVSGSSRHAFLDMVVAAVILIALSFAPSIARVIGRGKRDEGSGTRSEG